MEGTQALQEGKKVLWGENYSGKSTVTGVVGLEVTLSSVLKAGMQK